MADHDQDGPIADSPQSEDSQLPNPAAGFPSGENGIKSGNKSTSSKRSWRKILTPWLWLGKSLINAGIVIAVFLGILWSMGFAMRQGWFPNAEEGTATNTSSAGESKRYICPMMCVPPTTEPGRCPVCGMELVEAAAGGGGDGVSISIEPAHRRLIGVRTAMAKMDSVNRTIRTIGSIQYDESRLSTISAYVDGRLEKLFADYVGVPVGQGDDLALIYSPELYTAQAEFLAAQDQKASSRFVDSSRMRELAAEKLFELGMSEDQINTLKQEQRARSRIRVRSPQNGTVIEKLAVEGDYVKTGQSIYRVADLSTVWMMLDLFPDDAARVLFGQEVEAEISSAPGIVFTGRVAFIDPTVNPNTRSVRVRVEMLNLDGKLRPGDYATARVSVPAIPRDQVYDPALAGKFISPMHPQVIRDAPGACPICDMDLIPTTELGFSTEPLPEQKVVTIPRDAVLMAGNNSVVYVEAEPGRFEVRRISLGALTDEEAIVAEGLNAGETVATQGNFLLDSQSQLAGNPSLLDPSEAPKFAPGPLQIQGESQPVLLTSAAANGIDKAYQAYFEIQSALANDSPASPVAVNSLVEGLVQALADDAVPDEAQRELMTARNAAERLVGPIEDSRVAFRTVSHGMIKSLHLVRSSSTENGVNHFYCPMVPGGGGDWLQADEDLKNPYWGAEMLTCGELVKDFSLSPQPSSAESDDEDPFAGMEMQSLDFGN
ncbi:MAG: efflux RND transporter periplasmic adaptor subunit [Aureliella sp.]